jgi:hypothetical protein
MILGHQLIERHREQRSLIPTITAHKAHNDNARNLRKIRLMRTPFAWSWA